MPAGGGRSDMLVGWLVVAAGGDECDEVEVTTGWGWSKGLGWANCCCRID